MENLILIVMALLAMAAIVWIASIVAIVKSKNPLIRNSAIIFNLIVVSLFGMYMVKAWQTKRYNDSSYQTAKEELVIDGIRIPAGSKLTVAPQDGVSEKPDFSTFSEVTFSRPVEWKGIEVNGMNRSAYQTEDGYQATLTINAIEEVRTVDVEGWSCRSDGEIEWQALTKSGKMPSSPADYFLSSCMLNESAEVSLPEWFVDGKLYFMRVMRTERDGYWEVKIASNNQPYWGNVILDSNKQLKNIELTLAQKNLPGCAIDDDGVTLEWDRGKPDIVTVVSTVDLPELCWGKKVVRPKSKAAE
ncbi:MAG: hypothetical protein HXM87_05470 [Neisseria sp.]|uniref:hypothetical protein n=1 Tax=Neisseria sp. TaxID=192066 RepID=UPI001CB2A50D|nr:hypothetical protein [Neisseria sp.]MBF1277867.1 hypothetical protein [Neisseria sp.]